MASNSLRRLMAVNVCCVVLLLGLAGCVTDQAATQLPAVERVMKVTGYCPCGECCGWARNWLFQPVCTSGPNRGKPKHVGMTASGSMAQPGTIAADLTRYPFGTVMYIEGYGYGRVEDTGADIHGDHIDLFFTSHHVAKRWGANRMRVKIWFPEPEIASTGK